MKLYCGDALCKVPLPAVVGAGRFPIVCPSCGADLYPVDELEQLAKRDTDKKRSAIMVERGGDRVPARSTDLAPARPASASKEKHGEPDLDRLLSMVDVDGTDAKHRKTRTTIAVGVAVAAVLIALVLVLVLARNSSGP